MPVSGLISELGELVVENQVSRANGNPAAAASAAVIEIGERQISEKIKQIGRTGTLEQIIEAEKLMLLFEVQAAAATPTERGRLENTLSELAVAADLMKKVRRARSYREIAEATLRARGPVNGLPFDEARVFFRRQAAYLLDLDKSNLTPAEKRCVHERRRSLKIAERLYAVRQERALGLSPDEGRDLGLAP